MPKITTAAWLPFQIGKSKASCGLGVETGAIFYISQNHLQGATITSPAHEPRHQQENSPPALSPSRRNYDETPEMCTDPGNDYVGDVTVFFANCFQSSKRKNTNQIAGTGPSFSEQYQDIGEAKQFTILVISEATQDLKDMLEHGLTRASDGLTNASGGTPFAPAETTGTFDGVGKPPHVCTLAKGPDDKDDDVGGKCYHLVGVLSTHVAYNHGHGFKPPTCNADEHIRLKPDDDACQSISFRLAHFTVHLQKRSPGLATS